MVVQPPTVVIVDKRQPSCLLTLVWFIFIGSWASLLWSLIAWILIVLIITMPIGLKMINVLPKIATLREPSTELTATVTGAATAIQQTNIEQRPFLLRTIYFLLVGWWLSLLCLTLAWLASITLIGIPLAIWLYNRIPAVTTLRRY